MTFFPRDFWTTCSVWQVSRSIQQDHVLVFSFILCVGILKMRGQIDEAVWAFLLTGGDPVKEHKQVCGKARVTRLFETFNWRIWSLCLRKHSRIPSRFGWRINRGMRLFGHRFNWMPFKVRIESYFTFWSLCFKFLVFLFSGLMESLKTETKAWKEFYESAAPQNADLPNSWNKLKWVI